MSSEKLIPVNARVLESLYKKFKMKVLSEDGSIQDVIALLMEDYLSKKNYLAEKQNEKK